MHFLTSSHGWNNQEEFKIEDVVLMGWPKKWWSEKCPQELLKHKEGSLDEPRKLTDIPGAGGGGTWGCEGRALCKHSPRWGDMWALASQRIHRLHSEHNSLREESWVGPKGTNNKKHTARSSLPHPAPRDRSTLCIHSGALLTSFQGTPGRKKPEFPQEQWVQ